MTTADLLEAQGSSRIDDRAPRAQSRLTGAGTLLMGVCITLLIFWLGVSLWRGPLQFDDAFMSAEHAHIVMTPNGFTLADNQATNGTFVNEKRMTGRHELVDNDMVMFGKTSCKFKTIVGLG